MTDVCVHVGCDRPQRARTLCERHYMQLKRAGLGQLQRKQPKKAQGVQLDAQLGQNSNCVDCGDVPWHGGMRCWDCFKARVAERAETSQHLCVRHAPGASCYQICRCRCEGCREAKRMYQRAYR